MRVSMRVLGIITYAALIISHEILSSFCTSRCTSINQLSIVYTVSDPRHQTSTLPDNRTTKYPRHHISTTWNVHAIQHSQHQEFTTSTIHPTSDFATCRIARGEARGFLVRIDFGLLLHKWKDRAFLLLEALQRENILHYVAECFPTPYCLIHLTNNLSPYHKPQTTLIL